jgi:hypothetical protein
VEYTLPAEYNVATKLNHQVAEEKEKALAQKRNTQNRTPKHVPT